MGIFFKEFQSWILAAVVLLLTWLALKFKNRILRKFHTKKEGGSIDPSTLDAFSKGVTVLILFVSFMILLQTFGIDMVPLLTVSGISAAIIGFASKDVMANFFNGLMIYATRPFLVDDFIELPGKKITGTVEEIGWYLTTVRDPHKKCIYIPNSFFSTELLLNHSRMTHRRIEEKIRIRLIDEEKIATFLKKVETLMKTHPQIDQNEQIDVFLQSISPWGLEIDVKGYARTTNYVKFMGIKGDILLKIYSLAYQNGFKQEPL